MVGASVRQAAVGALPVPSVIELQAGWDGPIHTPGPDLRSRPPLIPESASRLSAGSGTACKPHSGLLAAGRAQSLRDRIGSVFERHVSPGPSRVRSWSDRPTSPGFPLFACAAIRLRYDGLPRTDRPSHRRRATMTRLSRTGLVAAAALALAAGPARRREAQGPRPWAPSSAWTRVSTPSWPRTPPSRYSSRRSSSGSEGPIWDTATTACCSLTPEEHGLAVVGRRAG